MENNSQFHEDYIKACTALGHAFNTIGTCVSCGYKKPRYRISFISLMTIWDRDYFEKDVLLTTDIARMQQGKQVRIQQVIDGQIAERAPIFYH